ncbi:MAG: cation-transporting P-type ATPase [Myxococcaceae bacterium]|nr:cation-transporting P-type ATPase [Myxococcaceae bacterium]
MVVFFIDEQPAPARVVRHSVAARRLRLEVPALRADRFLARRLERTARTWPGVLETHAEPRSGRMLVCYAERAPLLARLSEQPDEAPAPPAASAAVPRAGPQAPWHALAVEEVLERLDSAPHGLSRAEAARRLRRYGPNALMLEGQRSRLAILGEQLVTLPMGMLMGSAAASALAGDRLEAAAILAVVGLNAGLGYHIERRNQKLLASWQRLEAGMAQVLRDGVLQRVPAAELVPGDVLLVRAGDVMPADARVLESHRLTADEAALTGESEPQHKEPAAVKEGTALAERGSLLHSGTVIASGHGRALVVATGAGTELARVRRLVEASAPPPTPLARRLDQLNRRVAVLSAGAAVLAGAAGLAHGRPVARVLRSAVALGVAALPEGLPLVATAALVRSMQRLHARGLVVRRVSSAETLGGVTVICADKTGTLTRNEMRLEVLDTGEGPLELAGLKARPEHVLEHPPTLALAAALLNSDVDVHRNGQELTISGSSTERALVKAAHAAGLDGAALRHDFPRLKLQERSEGIHYVVSSHQAPGGGEVAFIKGAPEQVIPLCERGLRGPLGARGRERLLRRNEELAAQGLRVLGLAWRRLPARGAALPAGGYTFIGLMGLRDPLRPGAANSVRLARSAGIRTILVTGDQQHTAEAIAREVGLRGEMLGAGELAPLLTLPREVLRERLDRLAVLARVTPEDKMRLVHALRELGEIVAMAGDGINDAPALKAADVGVAVGARSSDMARQVADVVMAGEDLRDIIHAVGEGRIVQDNLRRALRFLFATNLSELALVVSSSLLGLPDPLSPMQLLWLNLLTDTLPGVALSLEPGNPDVLDRPPAPPDAPLLPPPVLRLVVRDGLLMAGLGAAGMALGGPPLAFGVLTATQIGYASACRAAHATWRPARGGSPRFMMLIGGAVALQVVALTFPPLRSILGLPALSVWSVGGLATGLVLPRLVSGQPGWSHRVRRGRLCANRLPLRPSEVSP